MTTQYQPDRGDIARISEISGVPRETVRRWIKSGRNRWSERDEKIRNAIATVQAEKKQTKNRRKTERSSVDRKREGRAA